MLLVELSANHVEHYRRYLAPSYSRRLETTGSEANRMSVIGGVKVVHVGG